MENLSVFTGLENKLIELKSEADEFFMGENCDFQDDIDGWCGHLFDKALSIMKM